MIATGFQPAESQQRVATQVQHYELSSGKQTSLFPAQEPLPKPTEVPIRQQELPLKSENTLPQELVPLEGKYEMTFVNKAEEPPAANTRTPTPSDELRDKRLKMTKEYSDRIKKLYALSENNEQALDELYKKPAYLRSNAKLADTPDPDDDHTSRYNLNDDKGLLGNNRFLHDNVD
jgi:hypothetical protein